MGRAMCSEGSVGIDVAYPDEFAGGYPFCRAFSPEELDCAGSLCHNDRYLFDTSRSRFSTRYPEPINLMIYTAKNSVDGKI